MLTKKTKDYIIQLRDAGVSQRQIAERAGVSRTTVVRVLASAPAAPQADAPELPPPPTDDAPDAVDSGDVDSLSIVRGLIARYSAEAKRCTGADDANAAKFARIASDLVPVLARLEKAKRSDEDAIVIPRAEFAARLEQMRANVRALAGNPPRCVDCGRKIRIAWAEEDESEDS